MNNDFWEVNNKKFAADRREAASFVSRCEDCGKNGAPKKYNWGDFGVILCKTCWDKDDPFYKYSRTRMELEVLEKQGRISKTWHPFGKKFEDEIDGHMLSNMAGWFHGIKAVSEVLAKIKVNLAPDLIGAMIKEYKLHS